MYSQALLILAKPSKKVQKLIGAPTKAKLNIPQLALAKLAQKGEHQTGMAEVPSSIPT